MPVKRILFAVDIERLENTSPVVGLLGDYTDATATWTCPDPNPPPETAQGCQETQAGCQTYTCCSDVVACVTEAVRNIIDAGSLDIDFVGF